MMRPSARVLVTALVFIDSFAANCAFAKKEQLDKFAQLDVQPVTFKIRQSGELRVCRYKGDRTPFFNVTPEGKHIGIDIKIAKRIADAIGVRVTFVLTDSFDEVITNTASGNCDIGISKLSFTAKRAQYVLYTDPYITLSQTLVINRIELGKITNEGFHSLNEVFGDKRRKIGVLKGTSYEPSAHKLFPEATIVPLESWDEDVIPALRDGSILAAFRDDWAVQKTLYSLPDGPLKLLSVRLKTEKDHLRMVVPLDNPGFLTWVNVFMASEDIRYTVDDLQQELDRIMGN